MLLQKFGNFMGDCIKSLLLALFVFSFLGTLVVIAITEPQAIAFTPVSIFFTIVVLAALAYVSFASSLLIAAYKDAFHKLYDSENKVELIRNSTNAILWMIAGTIGILLAFQTFWLFPFVKLIFQNLFAYCVACGCMIAFISNILDMTDCKKHFM